MATDLEIQSKIKKLKPSTLFIVETKKERQRVCRLAQQMKNLGVINFDVSTRELANGQFKVFAG